MPDLGSIVVALALGRVFVQSLFAVVSLVAVVGWVAALFRLGKWHETPGFVALSIGVAVIWLVRDLWTGEMIRSAADVALICFWTIQLDDIHQTRHRAQHHHQEAQ